jgi:hypothetical protein
MRLGSSPKLMSTFMYAVFLGLVDIVNILIRHSNTNVQEFTAIIAKNRYNSFALACSNGDLEMVKLLYETGKKEHTRICP